MLELQSPKLTRNVAAFIRDASIIRCGGRRRRRQATVGAGGGGAGGGGCRRGGGARGGASTRCGTDTVRLPTCTRSQASATARGLSRPLAAKHTCTATWPRRAAPTASTESPGRRRSGFAPPLGASSAHSAATPRCCG